MVHQIPSLVEETQIGSGETEIRLQPKRTGASGLKADPARATASNLGGVELGRKIEFGWNRIKAETSGAESKHGADDGGTVSERW